MGAALRFRLTTASAATLQFDLDGELRWDQPERVYREAAEPPQLESIRYAWDVRGSAILTPDGSSANGWARFRAALAVIDSRADPVVKVEVLRVEAGAETSELTLGPPTYQGFKIERVAGDEAFELDPKASHRVAWPIYVRFSARRVFARTVTTPDGTIDDVVGFEQTISQTYDEAALGELTWETTVTTAEGVDARPKAMELGRIPLPGSSWSYLTNGSDGVDVEILDPDDASETARIPTKVRVTSRVKQWGASVGASGPGTSPGRFTWTDARQDDGKGEVVRTVEASATGPGAEAWVRAKKPADAQEEIAKSDVMGRAFSAQWITRTPKNGAEFVTTIAGELTGGYQDFDYEPVIGGFAPVRFDGAIQPWQLTLAIRVSRRGGLGTKGELPFPPILRSPWALDRKASSEGFPVQEEEKKADTAARWVREAKLVYRAATPPSEDPVDWLRANSDSTVASYWLVIERARK